MFRNVTSKVLNPGQTKMNVAVRKSAGSNPAVVSFCRLNISFCRLNTRTYFLQRYLLTNCSVDVVFFLFFFCLSFYLSRERGRHNAYATPPAARILLFLSRTAARRLAATSTRPAHRSASQNAHRSGIHVGVLRGYPFFFQQFSLFFSVPDSCQVSSEVVNNLS